MYENKVSKIIQMVGKWNADRYEREYNHDLAMSMLLEEYKETMEAEEEVDLLDGLCDMQYVALGAVWKLGIDNIDFSTANTIAGELIESGWVVPISHTSSLISTVNTYGVDYGLENVYLAIFNLASIQMQTELGLDPEATLDALLAVCDSNATKSIEKVDSAIKANGSNKGEYYVPPTAALEAILGARHDIH